MKQKTAQETRHISIIGLVLIMLLPLLPTKAGNVVDENLPLAVRFCQSQMLSHPDYKTIDFNTKLKWNYTHGLLMQAIFATATRSIARPSTIMPKDITMLPSMTMGIYTITKKAIIHSIASTPEKISSAFMPKPKTSGI